MKFKSIDIAAIIGTQTVLITIHGTIPETQPPDPIRLRGPIKVSTKVKVKRTAVMSTAFLHATNIALDVLMTMRKR